MAKVVESGLAIIQTQTKMTEVKNITKSEVGQTSNRAKVILERLQQTTLKLAENYREKESDFTQSDFHIEVFRMTPILAKQVLKNCNVSYGQSYSGSGDKQVHFSKGYCTNRARDARVVGRIKDEVLKDWFFESSNIAFNTKGMLIDGQHSLSAIVEANKAVDVILKTGCRIGSVQKIDVSRVRTTPQRLKFSGALPMNEPDSKTNYRVNIAGVVLRSRVDYLGKKMRVGRICERGLSFYNDKAILKSHDKHREAIEWLYANKTRNAAFRQAGIIAPIAIFFNKDKEKAKEFYNHLISSTYVGTKSKGQNSIRKLHKLIADISRWVKNGEKDKLPLSYGLGRSQMNFWFSNTRKCISAYDGNRTFRTIK
ncbi:MAG TPA: hypothetical protein EYO81_00445 [Gammaproteobacteria bacterium]|nr:hypothetical protein [Gammaproteobacteria bacterium]